MISQSRQGVKQSHYQCWFFLGLRSGQRGQLITVEFLEPGAQTAWILLQGRLSRSSCFELGLHLQQLLAQGCPYWVLDLSQVQGLGPEALGLLAHWGDLGKLSLAGVQEGHARLLEAAKLGQRFAQYQNQQDYLARGGQ